MATAKEQAVIIGLKAFSSAGLDLLRQTIQTLSEMVRVEAVSSIYRISGEGERPAHVHDLRSFAVFDGMVLTLIGHTTLSPVKLMDRFRDTETQLRSETLRRSVNIHLFFYGNETIMTPSLTLPDPDFHLRAENVLPAAEICPDFVHPVLRKSLREVGKGFAGQNWGEFVAQGKAMLDF